MEADLEALGMLPNVAKLTPAELFALGHAYAYCKGSTELKMLANLFVNLHVLYEGNLLAEEAKKAITLLLYEGKFKEALDRFNHIGEPNEIVNPPPNHNNNVVSSLSSSSSEDLFEELKQQPALQEMNSSQKRQITDLASSLLSPKRKKFEEEKDDISSPLMDAATRELIAKLQEEDAKELEKRKLDNEAAPSCQICLDEISPKDFYPLDSCEHIFHPACLTEYIETQLASRTFPIICPIIECKREIDVQSIKDLLGPEKFAKFESFTLKNVTERNPEEYSCCPTPDCSYVFAWIAKEDSNDFECPQCKKRYCLNCRCPYHVGMTCKEFEKEDEKFLSFVKGQKFKQCPRCKYWVEKSMGCDHMSCRCGYQFCYACGGDYGKCSCTMRLFANPFLPNAGQRFQFQPVNPPIFMPRPNRRRRNRRK